jgi:hypothetical protein
MREKRKENRASSFAFQRNKELRRRIVAKSSGHGNQTSLFLEAEDIAYRQIQMKAQRFYTSQHASRACTTVPLLRPIQMTEAQAAIAESDRGHKMARQEK